MFKLILSLPILPLVLIFDALNIKKLQIKFIIANLLKLILALFIFLPIWTAGYFILVITVVDYFGFIAKPIPVSGTGSMYPTFPKGNKKNLQELAEELVASPLMLPHPNGIVLFGKRYFGYELKKGDIIQFENKKTDEITTKLNGKSAGMVKRIIALPDDVIELRDGLFFLNGSPLKEPYIAKPHSTFGGSFINECQKMTVPKRKLFVMGDNRKGSGDSRYELGYIDIQDVNFVIPFSDQHGVYDKNWRDTKYDLDKSSKIKIDKNKYLKLLNEKRLQAGVQPLKYQTKLEDSSHRRGETMLKFDDFSFEATKSGYTMKSAMNDSNYSNVIWGESPITGYYEAEELIENQFEFPDTKNFLLNKDYQEIGIAEVEGGINNCPAQVIVQHFAGFIPPNYKKENIDAWKKLLNRLEEIQPSWQDLIKYSEYYEKNKKDIDRINEIIIIRKTNIEKIIKKMEANEWLDDDQEEYINKINEQLADEQEKIAESLNKQ